MAYPFPKLEIVKDNTVRVYHPEVLEPITFLTATASAGAVSLTVKNNAGFSNTDPQTLILLEGFGSSLAEIVRVDGAITLGSALPVTATTFAHGINTSISKVLYDQIEISGAATAGGSKTVIDTVSIQSSGKWSDFVVTGTTYNYYFARFKNSLSTTPYFSAYSDAVSATGFGVQTVGFIRRNAFKNVSETFSSTSRWDANWIYGQIYLCELDVLKEKDTWGQLVEQNYAVSTVTTGMQGFSLPSDIEDTQTKKSILGIRIGTKTNMDFIDRPTFEWVMQDACVTTLATQVNPSDTTVVLTDSSDIPDSGSINYEGTTYAFTANDRTTNTLSGFTAFAITIPAGSNIWYNVQFGEPRRYTVSDGFVYFDVPPSSDFNGRNIWIDYYKQATLPTTDAATVMFNDPQLYISWIEMAIKKEKANGVLAQNDASALTYARRKQLLVMKDRNPNKLRLIPSVPFFRSSRYGDWRR